MKLKVGDAEINGAQIPDIAKSLNGKVRLTPVQPSPILSEQLGRDVYLKLEHHQLTGSFKLRGATNAISQLSTSEREKGVIAISTGNHGRGLAHAAKAAHVPCVICMTSLVPSVKRDAIAGLGAEILICGDDQDEAERQALAIREDRGLTYISPFDDLNVIMGQATLGYEIVSQIPDVETIIAPLSGGGLLGGIGFAAKTQKPSVHVIGVSQDRGPGMVDSLRAGKPVPVDEVPTLADSLSGSIGLDNQFSFDLVRQVVDDTALVSETEIAEAVRYAYWKERQVIEGGASVALAGILSSKIAPLLRRSGPVVVVLSGGNIDMKLHHRLISGENVDLMSAASAN